MLFMDFAQPKRLRVNGTASIDFSDPLLRSFEGAQLVVRVRAEHIFPNCPRYIHRMALEEISVYAPAAGHEAPRARLISVSAASTSKPATNPARPLKSSVPIVRAKPSKACSTSLIK